MTERLFAGLLKNDEMRRMAMVEVLAHLEFSRRAGRVETHTSEESVITYRRR